MITILISLGVFVLAVAGLSIGVIWGKRTRLKGTCGSSVSGVRRDADGNAQCETCTCLENSPPKSGGNS